MTTTTIGGNVGNSISGGHFGGDVTLVSVLGQALLARMLDPEAIRYIAATYVTTPQTEVARDALRDRGVVVLTGAPGCGRRTTAVRLLAELSDVPHTIVLDEDALQRPVRLEQGHGYLLDLDESRDLEGVAPVVGETIAKARTARTPLAIRVSAATWNGVGTATVPVVALTAPPALEVFRAHLGALSSGDAADAWAARDDVRERLSSPQDAVRMATIIAEVLRTGVPPDRQPTEVRNAFANWSGVLEDWFQKTSDGSRRALLLAIAALERASAATVLHAADQLADIVRLPREPGTPLTGPDIDELVRNSEGRPRDGRVGFFRPRYAEAVLDHVWLRRPQMRRVLGDWLIALPGSGDEDAARAERSLTALALRQADPDLACRAAATWATEPRTRPLAVEALTAAAISTELGRDVRRRMYGWAGASQLPEGLHLAVAEVCSGLLAQVFPQIALTRLRHLVIRPNERVRDAAIDALATLVGDRNLRGPVLGELSDWLDGEEPRRSMTGPAFLRLAALRRDDRIVLLDDHTPDDVARLAELWRYVLRQSPGDPPAPATDWLDAVLTGLASRETVADVLARTCRTSIDLGNLTTLLLAWSASHDPKSPEVKGLAGEILERATAHLRTHPTDTEARA